MTTPIRSAHEMREAAAKVAEQAAYLDSGQKPRLAANIRALPIEIAPVAAEEFVLVPRELTPEMYRDAASEFRYGHSLSELWRVLLTAAPPAPAPAEAEVDGLSTADLGNKLRDSAMICSSGPMLGAAGFTDYEWQWLASAALAALNPGAGK